MFQHTSSEVNGYDGHKHLKNTKIKEGTGTLFLYFLNVCDCYNRLLLKMYVGTYETSRNIKNFIRQCVVFA